MNQFKKHFAVYLSELHTFEMAITLACECKRQLMPNKKKISAH